MRTVSASERTALDYIDSHRQSLIDFAARLVATPSPNPPGDERAVAKVVADQLRVLGLTEITICGPRPERANLICCVESGRPGPTLLLNGHLDTKPTGDINAWQMDPYCGALQDGRLYGLGSADMKGPDAALVYGLAAAVHAGAELMQGKVLLVLSADEEGQVMDGARYLVQEWGLAADAVLIAEPCGVQRPWEILPLISRGFCAVRFVVRGTPGHSSLSNRMPVVNASIEAARLLLFLDDHLLLTHVPTPLCPQGPTINLGATLRGGQGLAMVPGQAEFTADIRTLPGMTRTQIASDLDQALMAFQQQYPRAQVTWEFVAGNLAWTPPTEISAASPLVQAVQSAASVVLGASPPFGAFPGGTDAIWWQGAAGIPTIPGFGPGLLSNAHQPNEWVAVDELVQAAKIYALTVLTYLGASTLSEDP